MDEIIRRVACAIRDSLGPLGDERYYLSQEEAVEAARSAIGALLGRLDEVVSEPIKLAEIETLGA